MNCRTNGIAGFWSLLFVLLALTATTSGCGVEEAKCESSDECRLQRVCFKGECRYLDAIDVTAIETSSPSSGDANAGGSGGGSNPSSPNNLSSSAPSCEQVCNHLADSCGSNNQLEFEQCEIGCRRNSTADNRRCAMETNDCRRIQSCFTGGS